MSLTLIPRAIPARPASIPAAGSLAALLGESLARRGVPYCQWKGHGRRERWETGRGDIDLLVDRSAWADFIDVLGGLGFKPAAPPPGREAPGVVHYFGLDERSGALVHVHAYARLVLGLPWRTHYRLPLEDALVDSAIPQAGAVFKTPAPELELIVLVLRHTLRHSSADVLRRRTPRWLHGVVAELERIEDRVSRGSLVAALGRYLPDVPLGVFDRCRDNLRPECSALSRWSARLALTRALAAHTGRPSPLAWPERLLARLRLEPAGHRLAGGGATAALLGGDGAGKSTCAEALRSWLAPNLAVLHAHLGRPPRSLLTLLIGGLLKLGGRTSRRVGAHLELLRSWATARDRYLLYRRARRFATRGGIALCERYPTRESWALAGPSDAQGRALDATSRLAGWLRRAEHAYYERITPPDVVFVLRLDPDTAVSRKPEEPADYVRERARLTQATDWSRSGATVLDAAQPLPQVVAALKAELWRAL